MNIYAVAAAAAVAAANYCNDNIDNDNKKDSFTLNIDGTYIDDGDDDSTITTTATSVMMVRKATSGKRLRDGASGAHMGFSELVNTILN